MKDLPSPHFSLCRGLFGVLLLWPLLVSCSALQITYSMADWIVLWKLDNYFNLSAAQETYLDREVKSLHVWHRYHQLPEYGQFLGQIDRYWENGLNQEELENILASVATFRAHLAKHASPPGATFLSTVTPTQIQHFQEVLDHEHHELVFELGTKPEERLTRRVASTLETLSFWLGDISEDQQISIRQWIAKVPDTVNSWLAHRQRRQSHLIELLRKSPDPISLESGLFNWLADSRTGATPTFIMTSEKWREGVKMVVLKIDRILTPDQRAHLSRKLHVLIRDIRGLVGTARIKGPISESVTSSKFEMGQLVRSAVSCHQAMLAPNHFKDEGHC